MVRNGLERPYRAYREGSQPNEAERHNGDVNDEIEAAQPGPSEPRTADFFPSSFDEDHLAALNIPPPEAFLEIWDDFIGCPTLEEGSC